MELANKLTRLHVNKPKTYAFLNFVFDGLLKPLPIAIALIVYFWITFPNNTSLSHETTNKMVYIIPSVFACYFCGILFHQFFLLMAQLFKLMWCTYKRLVIHVYLFDIVINLYKKKIKKFGSLEDKKFLKSHLELVDERYNKRDAKISKTYDRAIKRQEQRDKNEIEWRTKALEDAIKNADYYDSKAKYHEERARNGGGLLSTSDDQRKLATESRKKQGYEQKDIAEHISRINQLNKK